MKSLNIFSWEHSNPPLLINYQNYFFFKQLVDLRVWKNTINVALKDLSTLTYLACAFHMTSQATGSPLYLSSLKTKRKKNCVG